MIEYEDSSKILMANTVGHSFLTSHWKACEKVWKLGIDRNLTNWKDNNLYLHITMRGIFDAIPWTFFIFCLRYGMAGHMRPTFVERKLTY